MKAFASFFFLYTVALCIHLWLPITASSMLQQNETDRLALIAFKTGITQDPLGMLNSWNDTLHFCRSSSVYCSRQHVNWWDPSHPTSGTSPFLERQSYKTTASMGKYPSNRLFRLPVLFLNNNSFKGTVPTNITH